VSGATLDEAQKPIAVFLLDDHEVVRLGVRDLLEAEPDIRVVGEAGTAASALAGIEALRPDVAVLDVQLPDGDGVSVCREIRSRMPEVARGLPAGEQVYALIAFDRNGAAAGYVTVPAADLAGRPRSVSHAQAASLPLAALTAWQALTDHASLQPGERVLVQGGAGGVGSTRSSSP
jgi:two-component system, NarL family, response regulator DevR